MEDEETLTEDIFCVIEFPELAKTSYITSTLNEVGTVTMDIQNLLEKDHHAATLVLDKQFHFTGSLASPCGTNLFFRLPTKSSNVTNLDPSSTLDISDSPMSSKDILDVEKNNGDATDSVVYLGYSRTAVTFEIERDQSRCHERVDETTTSIIEDDPSLTTSLNEEECERGDWLFS